MCYWGVCERYPESDGPSRGTCNDERGRRRGSGYDGERASRVSNVAGPETVEYDLDRNDRRNLEFDDSHLIGFKIGIMTVNRRG
jgi:hypothetical protein